MIDQTLVFLKNQLTSWLKSEALLVADDTTAEQDAVVFVDGDKMEPLTFTSGAVSVLLVNIQQETTMRRAEPYRRTTPEGAPLRANREIRLDLSVLFVARFKQYDAGLKVLSGIVQFFQQHPAFDRDEFADLPESIERLMVEQVSLPFAEQNEVWNALRTTYHPSVLYRVRTLVFTDKLPAPAPAVAEVLATVDHKD
jgi:hypothetical protein